MSKWTEDCKRAIQFAIEHLNDPPREPSVMLNREDYETWQVGGWDALLAKWAKRDGVKWPPREMS